MILVRFYQGNRVDVTVKQHNTAVMDLYLVLHMVVNQLATQRDIQCRVTNQATHHQDTCQYHIRVINSLVQTISKDKAPTLTEQKPFISPISQNKIFLQLPMLLYFEKFLK